MSPSVGTTSVTTSTSSGKVADILAPLRILNTVPVHHGGTNLSIYLFICFSTVTFRLVGPKKAVRSLHRRETAVSIVDGVPLKSREA